MTSEEFQKLRATFDRLLEATDAERTSILDGLQQTDAVLARELNRMLAAHETRTSVLDRPIAERIGVQAAYSAPVRDGLQIGPYRIERELGLGGMGVVYLATRTYGNIERRVAIKILRHDRIDRLFLSRFQQERQILAQLTHPHIASILDAGEKPDGDPYFVMEYVDGSPITAHCKAHALTTDQKLDLFLQICDAVQYAHRNLTVHRDLKPGNVLVTGAGAVKLLDFGIAKLIEQPQDVPADALATAVILTPEYSSPEQIRREPITTATDVFALGILLYELVSGEHPFWRKGRLPHEVMRAICEDDPALPSAVAHSGARQIRGDLDTITLAALRKQPLWRYPSVEQLADDVRRYRRGWPVLAKGNGRWYRAQKFARRHWLPLAAAALLVLSLAAGILATTYQAHRADQARAIAETERERAETERARAELERANSDRQRALAQQAQQTAIEQRRVAEVRTSEAEIARQQERQRYRDVRSLASSLLFDLYDGVRDLAGSTTARRLIVSRAQHQLEMLTADGDDDIGLQRDLAASYERMGELRVDPHEHNKNDAAAAVGDYRKALDLRRKIAAMPGALPQDRRDLAVSLSKLGDGQFFAGDSKDAVASYQAGWEIARTLVQSAPADRSMLTALGTIDERRCVVLMAGGNSAGAMEACQEGISSLSPLLDKAQGDVQIQRTVASTEASYANALRLSQKPQEATKHATLALESLKRLEVLAPNNAEYRRLASTAETILASSLAANGNTAASLDAFRRAAHSMQVAMEIDPGDLGSALRLAVTLLSLSRRLSASGDKDTAHDTARQALQLLEQTANQPSAGAVEWNEYADALLKVEWPDLRQSAKALQLAQNAVSATNRKNPFILDTLAWAWFRTGDAAKAAETEREALRLLPANATGGLSAELSQALKTFTSGAPADPGK
jgi:tetratricopeptide (TPR) repeat protein/tRNA A-37 threonylcarbamoyl transferase component Bud32